MWKDSEKEKRAFVELVATRELSMSEVCRRFGVSRQTGYELMERFERLGQEAFRLQSRRPHVSPTATSENLVARIVEARRRYRFWGPRKIREWLVRQEPTALWPAKSTIGDILKREGLVDAGRRRRRFPTGRGACVDASAPNEVWSIDFKGWFRLQSGERCDPLTVTDNFSRFAIGCVALRQPRLELVQPALIRLFREYGLPLRMRSDNGPPFAGRGLGGLSRLAVWLIKLGIRPERIMPGKPQQNGRHERFHRTLKQETASPPKADFAAQQRAFGYFLRRYNEERPHEALGGQRPADVHRQSTRPYPKRIEEFDYDRRCDVRRVRSNGEIKWRGQLLFLSETLANEVVALETIQEKQLLIRFRSSPLAIYDERTKRFRDILTEDLNLSPISPDKL